MFVLCEQILSRRLLWLLMNRMKISQPAPIQALPFPAMTRAAIQSARIHRLARSRLNPARAIHAPHRAPSPLVVTWNPLKSKHLQRKGAAFQAVPLCLFKICLHSARPSSCFSRVAWLDCPNWFFIRSLGRGTLEYLRWKSCYGPAWL